MRDKHTDNSRNQLFVELLTANQARIRAYILSLVANFNDADDLMQETSKTMWTRFGEFQEGTNFLAWGFQIAHYRILEYRRRNKQQIALLDDKLIDDLSDAAQQRVGNSDSVSQHLYGCIQRLDVMQQKMLMLKYEHDLKPKEIAGHVGKSVHVLYKTFAKIHELLLSCIKRSIFLHENP